MQTIFYTPPKTNFTIIPNKLLQDKDLSIGAKFLASFILSLPKDFKINLAFLSKNLGQSARTLQRYFKELIDNNYLIKSQAKNEQGHFNKFNVFVFVDENTELLAEELSKAEKEACENDTQKTSENLKPESENENQNEAENDAQNPAQIFKSETETKLKNESINLHFKANSKHKKALNLQIKKENERAAASASKTALLKTKVLNLHGRGELQELKEAKIQRPNRSDKNPQAVSCRPYKEIIIRTKKEKNSKGKNPESYAFSFLQKDILIYFLKKQGKTASLDFSFFSEAERRDLESFFEYRKEKANGKGITLQTKRLILKKCEDFKKRGFCLKSIIEKSIMNGWSGLFEPKEAYRKDYKKSLSARELSQEIISKCVKLNPNFEVFNKEAIKGLKIDGRAVLFDESTFLYSLENAL